MHTTSFPQILQSRGISVLVTTYQAGRLVMLRADGAVLNQSAKPKSEKPAKQKS